MANTAKSTGKRVSAEKGAKKSAKTSAARPAKNGSRPAKGAAPAAKPGGAPAAKSGAAPAAKPGAEREVRVARAEFTAGAASAKQIPPPEVVEIAFAGRSNVGKSSLLNMMLARKGLARTSRTPGCTRQINFFDVGVASGPSLAFVDLPGYGYAKVSRSESHAWKNLLESYLRERATLRAVVVLVDVRRGVEQEERDLVEFLGLRPDLRVVVAVTKLDKLPRNQQKPALAAIQRAAGVRVYGTSAETRAGREELWAEILRSAKDPTPVALPARGEAAADDE